MTLFPDWESNEKLFSLLRYEYFTFSLTFLIVFFIKTNSMDALIHSANHWKNESRKSRAFLWPCKYPRSPVNLGVSGESWIGVSGPSTNPNVFFWGIPNAQSCTINQRPLESLLRPVNVLEDSGRCPKLQSHFSIRFGSFGGSLIISDDMILIFYLRRV